MNHFLGKKGQSAVFDMVIIFLCIALFASVVWAFSLNGRAPETQAQRARQDFTKSLLISMLYNTPDSSDPRYNGKTMSDFLGIYMSKVHGKGWFERNLGVLRLSPEEVLENEELFNFTKERLMEAKIGSYLENKNGGANQVEWLLTAEEKINTEERGICIWGHGDEIEVCPDDEIIVYESSTASAKLVYPTSGGAQFLTTNLYLTIKWA